MTILNYFLLHAITSFFEVRTIASLNFVRILESGKC